MDQNHTTDTGVVHPSIEEQINGLHPVDDPGADMPILLWPTQAAEALSPLDWAGHVSQADADEHSAAIARSETEGWVARQCPPYSLAIQALAGHIARAEAQGATLAAAELRAAKQLLEAQPALPPPPRRQRLRPGLMGHLLVGARDQTADTVHGQGDAAMSADGMDDLRQEVTAAQQDLARDHPQQAEAP